LNMSVKMAVLEEAPHAHLSAEAKRYIQYLMCCTVKEQCLEI
jgi:hypothetical protein